MVGRMGRTRDVETIAHRLTVWRRLATAGVEVAVIAARLGISPAALNATVYRERRRGNPDAVHHANHNPTDPDPSGTVRTRRASAARWRLRQREAR